jgi:cyclic pyranopterin monophosphate synthase
MSASKELRMVDIGAKQVTVRQATAKGVVLMLPATFKMLMEAKLPKGDALAAARLAGIMAAKKTPELIPMCHPLLIENVSIDLKPDKTACSIEITATIKGSGKTGFEMEAMTAVAIAALTIYDMCKAVDSSMRVENIRLIKKSGGKSGDVVLET